MDADILLCKAIFFTVLVIITSLFGSLFILRKVLTYLKPSKPAEVTEMTKTVVWDLQGLQKKLKKFVYGQDDAVNRIMQIIHDMVTSRKVNSRPKIIVLVGGPGVGKHHVMNIIKNHIESQPVNEKVTKPWDLRFEESTIPINKIKFKKYILKQDIKGIRPMFAHFDSLYHSYYQNNENLEAINIYQDPLCFVTGSVMSQWTALNIASYAKYEYYLNCKTCSVHQFGSHYFKNSDIIVVKFKPMTQEQIQKFWHKKNLTNQFPRDGKDFVALGFKAVKYPYQ